MSYVTPETMKMKVRFLREFKQMREQLTINTQVLSPELQMFKHAFDAAARVELEQQAQAKRLTVVEKKLDNTAEILALSPTEWRKKVTSLISKIVHARARDDQPNYQAVWSESYKRLAERTGCKLDTRLKNIRKNMALEGVSQSERNKLNFLDAIAKDAKLVEIYLAKVKEMAIQYQVEVIEEETETCLTLS